MYIVWVPYVYPDTNQYMYPVYYASGPYLPYRVYPGVDPGFFIKSASAMENLMSEARTVIQKIETSEEFANEVMGAAQESDQSKVVSLIKSTGVSSPFEAEYNPDRLKLNMSSSVEQLECCKLTIMLRWRK